MQRILLSNFLKIIWLSGYLLSISCGSITERAAQQVKSTSTALLDTLINKILPEKEPEHVSIRNMVKNFEGDTTIKEIKAYKQHTICYI